MRFFTALYNQTQDTLNYLGVSKIFSDGTTSSNNISVKTNAAYPYVSEVHILVAEDNQFNLLRLKGLLQQLAKKLAIQIHVTTAGDGIQAVNNFTQNQKPFDLVIMDCQMPHKDGFEATRDIRAFNKTTPIVALTSNDDLDIEDQCEKAGMNAYYPKPILLEGLEGMFDKFVFSHYKNQSISDTKNNTCLNMQSVTQSPLILSF